MLSSFTRAAALIGLCVLASVPAIASRELKDELGRPVTLPDNPQRVVCLAPSLTETVYALGAGSAVAGVTNFTDAPPEARTKPSVGGLTDASLEKIVSLRPDLVLAMGTLNREETVNELEHLGIPVFVVDPRGLQGILDSIQHVGDALNRSGDAAQLVKRLEAQWAAVAARVEGRPRLKVLVVIWYDPVVTAGRRSFITDVIAAAGGESVTADLDQAWPQISLEEVLRRSPDFLLLVRDAHGGTSLDDLETHSGWDQLAAVKYHRVIYMGDRLFHPSPVVFEALGQLAKELHPEAFQAGPEK
ncbi:MAG TPA: cobalamin-binding protein [Terriglobia bacterium]|nr:cobalamin-binding protein [Terriglobia bacterium]